MLPDKAGQLMRAVIRLVAASLLMAGKVVDVKPVGQHQPE